MVSQLFSNEPTCSRLYAALLLLSKRYPWARLTAIGQSPQGRTIHALRLGEGHNPSLLAGGFEYGDAATVLLLLRFAEKLCSCLHEDSPLLEIDVRRVLSRRGTVILPCLCPDSLEESFPADTDALSRVSSALCVRRLYSFAMADESALEYCSPRVCTDSTRLMAGILAAACGFPVRSVTTRFVGYSPSCPAFRFLLEENGGVSPYPRMEEALLLTLML